MASNTLELKVLLSAIDKITAPLKAMQREGTGAAKRIKEMHKELAGLKRTSGQVGEFARLKQAVQDSSKALEAAQKKTNEAARAMQGMGPPTKEASKAFAQAQKEAAKLKEKHGALTTSLQKQRDALAAAGISTRTLSADKAALSAKTNTLTASIDKESAALAKANERARQLHATRAKYSAMQSKVDAVRQGSQTAAIAGAASLGAIGYMLQPAQAYQTEIHRIRALGMGEEAVARANNWARASKTAGVSMAENIEIFRDGLATFSDARHAEMAAPVMQRMKYANEALFGAENAADKTRQLYDLLKVIDLRGATNNAAEFAAEADKIQRVLTSTGGRVGAQEYRDLISRGGVAAKRMDSDAFYNVLEPMVQDMGGHSVGTGLMSAYQNLYNGKTTTAAARRLQELNLINPNQVEYDKTGQLKRLKVGSIKDSELYAKNPFEWIDKTLVPALHAQGITGTDNIVKEISGLITNRKGADLFAAYVMQRDVIQRSAARNRQAAGVNEIYAEAQSSIAGQKKAFGANWDNLKQALAEGLLPQLDRALRHINAITTAITNWAKENPKTAQTIMALVAVFGSLLLILGTAGIALTAIIVPMLAFGAATGIALWPILAIVAAVALLVAASVMLYLRWNDIAAWWSGLWAKVQNYVTQAVAKIQSIIQSFNPLQLFYSAFAGVLRWFGIDLPAKFTDFGKNIIQGLINGIKAAWEGAKKAVRFVADAVKSAFTTANAIHSPSRVFHQYGAFLMQGLEQGITRTTGLPVRSMRAAAQQIIRTPMSAIKADTRAPIGGGMFGGAGALAGAGGITIHVHAAPGMSEHTLASLVARKIEEATRTTARTRRTSFMDMD